MTASSAAAVRHHPLLRWLHAAVAGTYATHALLLLRFRPAAAAEPAGSVGARLAGA
ncbi:MAG: hypothetical protein AB7S55_05845 [Thiomonas sp.]